MQSRVTFTLAIGVVAALSLGRADAGAQQSTTSAPGAGSLGIGRDSASSTMGRGSLGIQSTRVRKDAWAQPADVAPAVPAPAPEPAPLPAPDSTAMRQDTSVTVTTSVSTGEVATQPAMSGPRFGNGFYWGLHAGANFPQNEIDTFYETGFSGGALLGWDPETSPLGLRLNLTYNRLNGKELTNQNVGAVRITGEYEPSDLYSAFADAKLRLPFGRFLGSTSGLYLLGGAGVTYFRNYQTFSQVTGTPSGESVTGTFNSEDVTRFAINGGGGLSWGLGRASLFVEGRYVRTFTPGRDTDWVPVSVGLTFR